MRVYRHQYKVHAGQTKLSTKWYLEFRDHLETVRRLPGYTDKKATEELGRKLERLVSCKLNGEQPDPTLTKWLAAMPNSLRSRLAALGLIDGAAAAKQKPLAEHLEGFRASLSAKGGTAGHVDQTLTRLRLLFDGCGFRSFGDIRLAKVEQWLADQRAKHTPGRSRAAKKEGGISRQTSNYYVGAAKQFCKWMAKQTNQPSPLEHLGRVNAAVGKGPGRRDLNSDELRRLLDTTRQGPDRFKISGPDRAILYRLAAESGLRANELRTLKRSSFRFGTQATVVVEAANAKGRKRAELPLRPDTAAILESYLEGKPASARALKLPRKDNMATMLRRDLSAARQAWLEEATTAERAKREKSDFLTEVDAEGRIVDFHALRHSAISNLARAGVHPKVAQQLARHSTITLTMDRYSHVKLDEQAKALAMLPGLDSVCAEAPDDGKSMASSVALSVAFLGSPDDSGCRLVASADGEQSANAKRDAAKPKRRKTPSKTGLEEVRLLGLEPKTYGLKVSPDPDLPGWSPTANIAFPERNAD